MECKKCGSYGTIVLMGKCCKVAELKKADETANNQTNERGKMKNTWIYKNEKSNNWEVKEFNNGKTIVHAVCDTREQAIKKQIEVNKREKTKWARERVTVPARDCVGRRMRTWQPQ